MSNIKRTYANFKNPCITKKSHICSVINLFQLHCRWLIKSPQAKKYSAINFKYLAYQCKFTSRFVWSVCPHCQTWNCIEAERPWASNISFVLRVFDVRKLWSLWLWWKMEPYKFWQINHLSLTFIPWWNYHLFLCSWNKTKMKF